ncbi:homing endonuclease associated repeat-containing protein [Halobacterium bonnevillei]|uniref:Uncharacterized protein n=1 Tax=Halobacterium bonnevillei TaxID=2692200 RepID=A0A6B0SH36_9EURY|nr:hypothetical protein [Halobacterium bonnevillei]MXR20327.1 hypothetical protein [Halobacterium bonnevillei]
MAISKDACLKALQKAADELGHAPTVAEYKDLDVSPCYNTIRARFGSWTTALEYLDVDQQPRRYWKVDCIEAFPDSRYGDTETSNAAFCDYSSGAFRMNTGP